MAKLISITNTTRSWAEQRQVALEFALETASTNDLAKKQALKDTEKVKLYLTDHQTAGRGRGDHHWLDTGVGESLLSTWSFQMSAPPQPITGPRVGLALFRAAGTVWPSLPWSLKAPNDLYLNGKKIAGLLVETVSSGGEQHMAIGLGLNVLNHPRAFLEATHLSQHTPLDDGEWFQFLDELFHEFSLATEECTWTDLSPEACEELARALNANSAKTLTVLKVSPAGDLIHAGGKISWMDL